MAAVIVEQVSATPQQQLFTQASAYLHDQLRSVFENCEKDLLAAGEQIALCCDLRRARKCIPIRRAPNQRPMGARPSACLTPLVLQRRL